MIDFFRQITIGSLGVLRELNLNPNQMGDEGMKTLSAAISSGSLCALEYLALSINQIGDVGMIEFSCSKSPSGHWHHSLISMSTMKSTRSSRLLAVSVASGCISVHRCRGCET